MRQRIQKPEFRSPSDQSSSTIHDPQSAVEDSALCTPHSALSVDAVSLDHVSFTYAEATTPALCNISLNIPQGKLVVIMGASGAGKSTLVKCLNRVIPAFQSGRFAGEVRLFGRQLRHEKVGQLAGTVGMVFQDFEAQLFSTTVRDEVLFGMEQLGVPPQKMDQRLRKVLVQVGLAGFEARDPTTLSGGEKQRLAIAALLALQPQIFVLDEPTTDLDPQGRQEIFALLGRMRGDGSTLIVVEHELAAAVAADQIVLLAAGEIVAAGSPRDVLPQIDLLTRYGIRPHDLDRFFQALQVREYPRDIEGALRLLRERFLLSAEVGAGWDEDLVQPHLYKTPPPTNSFDGVYHEPPATPPRTSVEVAQDKLPRKVQGKPFSQGEPGVPLLQLQSVTHVYPNGSAAIHGINLSIGEGEFIALLGQNGSGKTTLAKHLSGLLTPTQGRVLLRGHDLGTVPLHQLAQEVSYVFQNPDHQLFAATVEEEVAFGPRNIGLSSAQVEARVEEALQAVGWDGSREHDPFLLGKGERQRLAVAALLALHPRMLILDEPTTGLDYPEQRHMMALLRRLHQEGRTIMIITHVPWVAVEYAERALLMAQGRLLWDGPVRALCTRHDLHGRGAFRPPDITLLSQYCGMTALSVEEFVGWVEKRRAEGTREGEKKD
jgi:cobalt transport protein ATP-binding subunit